MNGGARDDGARRVAHVLRKYHPLEWGGTESHVVELTRRLGAHGYRSEVHAPRGPSAPDRMLDPEVPLLRYRALGLFVGSRERRRALWANAGNIAPLDEPIRLARDRGLALAHLHTMGAVGAAVRTAMRWTGRPYLLSVHGPLAVGGALEESGLSQKWRGAIDLGGPLGALFGARRVVDDAARTIVFNDAEHEALAARIGERAVRMEHGIEWRRFASGDAARARRRWPALGDAPVVAALGRLSRQKNQQLAIRAFARGAPADHRLALAGATVDASYRRLLEDEARALGVGERVHFLGNLQPDEVPDLLARARLALLPSSWESFGLAVVEAWAASRPVLFARRHGLVDLARRLADDGPAIATLDEEDWIAATRRFLASEPLRAAAAAAGHELLRARYDIDVVAAEVAALYDRILDEHAGAARGRR